jgi:hypothetical protein
MLKPGWVIVVVLLSGFFAASSFAAEEMTAEQIIQKNISAVGGKEKIDGIKTASIQFNYPGRYSTTVYTQGKNLVKMVDGISPIVESVIIIKNGEFSNKSYRIERILSSREKCFCLAMQKLVSGAFSLTNFNNDLEYKGIKKLGPEKHFIFETILGGCPVQLSLDTETYLLKRMIIEDIVVSDYKATYDFLPSAENLGLMIPEGWYQCDLGTGASAEGTRWQLNNYVVNPQIENSFFSDMELNMGMAYADIGNIMGNLTASTFNDQRGYGFFGTNVIREDLDKAGLKVEDKFILRIDGKEYEGFILASTDDISSSTAVPGNIIFANLSGSAYYGFIIFGEQFKPLFTNFQPLKEFLIVKK